MDYLPRVPTAPPLAGVVEVLFHLDGYRPGHQRERVVPNGRMTLVIELDGRERHVYDNDTGAVRATFHGAWLSGVHRRYLTIGDTAPGNRLMAVQFAPGTSTCLTGRPADAFADAVVPAAAVFGGEVLQVRERLLAAASPADCLDTLEAWLIERHDPAHAPPAFVADATAAIQADPTAVRLTALSAAAGVSHRHFLAQFRRHVGVTPKVLQRILRFHAIFERLQGQERVRWAALAQELGFADQAHLIREFRAFSGYRPAAFQAEGHDRQNFFPDDPA